MGNIRVPGYALKREITISISEEDGEFFASFSDLNLTGRGDSEEEARRDLGELLVIAFEDTAHVPDSNLSRPLIADKEFLLRLMEKTK